jgi:hypothetical protein
MKLSLKDDQFAFFYAGLDLVGNKQIPYIQVNSAYGSIPILTLLDSEVYHTIKFKKQGSATDYQELNIVDRQIELTGNNIEYGTDTKYYFGDVGFGFSYTQAYQ